MRPSNYPGAVVLVLALWLAPSTAFSATTFSDTEFPVGDWTTIVTRDDFGNLIHSVTQGLTEGNPAKHQRVTVNASLGGSCPTSSCKVTLVHFKAGATYDPLTAGAILSIDYQADYKVFDTGLSQAYRFQPMLRQGGVIYRAASTLLLPGPTWLSVSKLALTAVDFLDQPTLTTNPDFSASGGVIEFGYTSGAGTAFSVIDAEGGIDNWSVAINSAPEPVPALSPHSLVLVAGFMLLTAAFARRRPRRCSGRAAG